MMAVIGSRGVHQARCRSVEAFKERNRCVADAFNYNKGDDFFIGARFRGLILAAMST